jgi:predicted hydrolase (HD superfamily)
MAKLDRKQARDILESMTKGQSLLRHARTVELVMEAYGKKFGEDAEEWAITGMLHDADYEAYPDEHPNMIVKKLTELGEDKKAYAISAHYTLWGNPCKELLDKALLACDELTGFIVACAQVRPTGIEGLEPKSVKKKLKTKEFAAKVDRDEINKGIALLGVDLDEHIRFIVDVLTSNREELGI